MKKLPDHELAGMFPMAEGEDRERLKKSLETNGQIEEVVTHEGKVLDGRNRADLLIEMGRQPRYINWKDLPEEMRGASPLAFVIARNLDRRHLTQSQKAAVAAEALPLFEKEAQERKSAGLRQNRPTAQKSANGDGIDQRTGTAEEDESQSPKRKGKKGKASAVAGETFGVSARSVEKAKALKKRDPKKFAEVKAGKVKLSKADRDAAKEKKAADELEDACKRIGATLGRGFAGKVREGEILKGKRSEILALSQMSEADMEKVKGLLENGWTLDKARKYKMTELNDGNSIRDLAVRAIAKGVAKEGSFTMTVTVHEVPLEITVRKAK